MLTGKTAAGINGRTRVEGQRHVCGFSYIRGGMHGVHRHGGLPGWGPAAFLGCGSARLAAASPPPRWRRRSRRRTGEGCPPVPAPKAWRGHHREGQRNTHTHTHSEDRCYKECLDRAGRSSGLKTIMKNTISFQSHCRHIYKKKKKTISHHNFANW